MTKSRWPEVPLHEVLALDLHPHIVEPTRSYPIAGVYGFGRGMIKRPPVLGQELSATQLFQIKSGQFIYSRLKSFEGAFAIVTDDADGYFVSNEFPTFSLDPNRLALGFIRWWFKRPGTWESLAGEGRGIGARRERLHPEKLLQSTIPLPTLEEQRRIVAQLDGVAQRIEQRAQTARLMEAELAAALMAGFQKLVVRAPRVPMRDVAPLVRRPVEINPEDKYPELGVRSFGKGTFHKPALSGFEVGTKRLFRIEGGDLLFNIVFAWEGAVAVATAADDGRMGSHRFLTCVPNPTLATSEFLRFFFLTTDGIERLGKASPGGAGRNRTLGLEALDAIGVPIPALEDQQWFDRLQRKAADARRRSAEAATELDHLIPAVLNRVL